MSIIVNGYPIELPKDENGAIHGLVIISGEVWVNGEFLGKAADIHRLQQEEKLKNEVKGE